MPAVHGKKSKVYYNTVDLSYFFREASTPGTADTAETSTFGVTDKTYVAGKRDGRIAVSGVYDGAAAAVDEKLAQALIIAEQTIDDVVSIVHAGSQAPGERLRFGAVKDVSYNPASSIGDVVGVSAEFQCNDGIHSGLLLADPNVANAFGTTLGTIVDAGTDYVYPTQGAVGVFQVLQNSLDVTTGWKIMTSTSPTFAAGNTSAMLFASVLAGTLQAEVKYDRTVVLNRYLRFERNSGVPTAGTIRFLIGVSRHRP